MTYEALMIEAESHQLIVKEKPLKQHDGLIIGNKIGIREDIPTLKEKACVLAEELGHYHTTTGRIFDQTKVENRKQEYHARLWAYNKQIGLTGIVDAFRSGCRNRHEAAEYLGVTEEFLMDALNAYRSKYGVCTTVDNYIIYFEPCIGVMEITGDSCDENTKEKRD